MLRELLNEQNKSQVQHKDVKRVEIESEALDREIESLLNPNI